MQKQTQKEAVFSAITNVLSEHGVKFETGTNVGPLMTKEFRGLVNAILVESFKSGAVELSKEFDSSALSTYASSLQSNWIRKDKRLNGNIAYVASNPGSRAGSGDPQLKAMRQLIKTLTVGTADYTEVADAISERLESLKTTKAKSVKIDLSALPEALRSKFEV